MEVAFDLKSKIAGIFPEIYGMIKLVTSRQYFILDKYPMLWILESETLDQILLQRSVTMQHKFSERGP